MQSKMKNNIIFLRLFPNEDVNIQLKNACKINNVKTAIIISGIGQLKNVKLGYFKEKGNYAEEIFKTPLEILSLNGNICRANEGYITHIHAILGDENKNALGGHFLEGIVSVTAEIVLLKAGINVERKDDSQTGLKMLYFK